MKLIYPDNISAASADEEDSDYPAENVMNEHPKKVWKATSSDATLTLTVGGGSNGAFIYATNGTSITVTVKDGGGSTVFGPTAYTIGDVIDAYEELITDDRDSWDALWVDYDYQSLQHTIEIAIDAGGAPAIAEIGVVKAGLVSQFKDPQYGLSEGLLDYSVKKELNNGAFYYRKRDVVRTFGVALTMDRDTEFYKFMLSIIREIGPAPLAWWIAENQTNQEWGVYGRVEEMPTGRHSMPDDSTLEFNIIEVV